MPIGEILADLNGKDVHHRSGVGWDNRPGNLEAIDHGEHSSITNTQLRAWGEDAKRQADESPEPDVDECGACGDSEGPLATSDGFEGRRCLDCAMDEAGGNAIDVRGR